MFIHSRLTQHVSGIIMPIVRRTDCIKPRVVLAWMCWLRLGGVRSAPVATPHNRSQHIQANTRHGFIQSILLTMGIMMPETCWVNLLWINIYICVICWFFLLLSLVTLYEGSGWHCNLTNVTDQHYLYISFLLVLILNLTCISRISHVNLMYGKCISRLILLVIIIIMRCIAMLQKYAN